MLQPSELDDSWDWEGKVAHNPWKESNYVLVFMNTRFNLQINTHKSKGILQGYQVRPKEKRQHKTPQIQPANTPVSNPISMRHFISVGEKEEQIKKT